MDGYRSDFPSFTLFCINGMLIRTSAKAKCKCGFTLRGGGGVTILENKSDDR